MAYEAFYSVRSSEIGSDYRLTKTGAAFFFQECAAEYFTSKGLAGYDMARHSLTWLISGVETRFSGQMPFWRERVKVQVWIRGVSAARMYVDFIQQERKGRFLPAGKRIILLRKFHRIDLVKFPNIPKPLILKKWTHLQDMTKYLRYVL